MSDPATAVFTRRVRPGHEAAYEQLAREAAAAATRYPGHLAATVLHKDGTVDYTVLYSFSDRAALDAWLDSPSRRRFAAQAEPFSVAHYELPRNTGLETWFMLPHERRVGLNHLALDVVGVEALHSWETTLDASNVVRSPIVESPFGWHLNVRAPDNIAVELLAMKPEASAALCG